MTWISRFQELIGVLESQAASLRAAAAAIHNGQSTGSQAASLERLAERLEGFVKKPYSIPEQLSGFREELSTLASLLLDLRSQPLELDYLFVGRPGTALPAGERPAFLSSSGAICAVLWLRFSWITIRSVRWTATAVSTCGDGGTGAG